MFGLIVKDLLCLKKSALRLIVILGLYIVIFSSADNIIFLCSMIILISTTLILNTFAYDEAYKWDYYALSLPVTKKQIVLTKYLLTVLFDVIGFSVALLLFLIKRQINTENVLSVCVLTAAALLMSSILLPLLYKIGTQKARIWLIMIFLIPVAGVALMSTMGINLLSAMATVSNSVVELLFCLALPVAALIFIGSYFLSCRIFKNKEI
jgi:hypothetical protein